MEGSERARLLRAVVVVGEVAQGWTILGLEMGLEGATGGRCLRPPNGGKASPGLVRGPFSWFSCPI